MCIIKMYNNHAFPISDSATNLRSARTPYAMVRRQNTFNAVAWHRTLLTIYLESVYMLLWSFRARRWICAQFFSSWGRCIRRTRRIRWIFQLFVNQNNNKMWQRRPYLHFGAYSLIWMGHGALCVCLAHGPSIVVADCEHRNTVYDFHLIICGRKSLSESIVYDFSISHRVDPSQMLIQNIIFFRK